MVTRDAVRLVHLQEPKLLFGGRQAIEDIRDGLSLFGPVEPGPSPSIRIGVVATRTGAAAFRRWAHAIHRPMPDGLSTATHGGVDAAAAAVGFPGFETVFGVPFVADPRCELLVDEARLAEAARIREAQRRIPQIVDLYTAPIERLRAGAHEPPHLWFIIVPDAIYQRCQPPLRGSEAVLPHFRHLVKARLLDAHVPAQIVRESTLAPADDRVARDRARASEVAWNLSAAVFYRAGARPWQLADGSADACHLGLVFARDPRAPRRRWATSAMQVFEASGDGVVIAGEPGPWFVEATRSYHLDERAARTLMQSVLTSYRRRTGTVPRELFVHGDTRFSDAEWRGFSSVVPRDTLLVGVRIRRADDLRLFGPDRVPPPCGLAYRRDARTAYLWTQGFIPRLATYPGREQPKALLVDICRGHADLCRVVQDIWALSRVNYHSCGYGDGEPITRKYASAVGATLAAASPSAARGPIPLRLCS